MSQNKIKKERNSKLVTISSRISFTRHLSYPDRLAVLYLETLEIRRVRFDLLLYYKICRSDSIGVINHSDHFKSINYTSLQTRSNSPKVVTPIGCSNKLLNNFFHRHVHLWNSLPSPVTNAPSIFYFCLSLMLIDTSKYLKDDFTVHFTINFLD